MPLALQDLWHHLQRQLFPVLVAELGELGHKDRQCVQGVSLLRLEAVLARYNWPGIGCPPHARSWLLHAFIAKEVYQFPNREARGDALRARPTLRRLCGWESGAEIPSLSTFCRACAQFATDELPQPLHAALIGTHCGPHLVGHVSRDATAIAVPERPPPVAVAADPVLPPVAPPQKPRAQRGEPRPPPPPTRLQQPAGRTVAENLADLPRACDSGAKQGSQGPMEYWRGCKPHRDVIDGDIPVSAVLTSASTQDSQVAIPLLQMTATRVCSLYDLMDAAYDAQGIHAYARGWGHGPIIEPVQRGQWVPLDPAARRR